MRSAIYRAMTRLICVIEVGIFRSGNLGKLGGNMWLGCGNQLVVWVLYNDQTIRQHFILLVTTLKTWNHRYWYSTWCSLANDPCRIDVVYLHTIEQKKKSPPPHRKYLIPEPRSTPSSNPIPTISKSLVLICNCHHAQTHWLDDSISLIYLTMQLDPDFSSE